MLSKKRIEYNRKTQEFLDSKRWQNIRRSIFKIMGESCLRCGKSKSETIIQIDHIKPRSKNPDKWYDFDNLQVLCIECNKYKSDKYELDFRTPQIKKDILQHRIIIAKHDYKNAKEKYKKHKKAKFKKLCDQMKILNGIKVQKTILIKRKKG